MRAAGLSSTALAGFIAATIIAAWTISQPHNFKHPRIDASRSDACTLDHPTTLRPRQEPCPRSAGLKLTAAAPARAEFDSHGAAHVLKCQPDRVRMIRHPCGASARPEG